MRRWKRVGMGAEAFLAAVAALLLLATLALADTVEQGRFGRALRVSRTGEEYAAAEGHPVYSLTPMTVELWAKIDPQHAKAGTIALIASEPANSATHWEMDAAGENGNLIARWPGYVPKEIRSDHGIADGKWHYLAMVFDGKSVSLHVDGQQVATQAVRRTGPYPDTGPLNFGHMEGADGHAEVLLDEVRISRTVRPVDKVPDAPFKPDADTVGLWHFDEDAAGYDKTGFADASATRNPARLKLVTEDADHGGFNGTRGNHTRWADMDFGPFFSSSLGCPYPAKGNFTAKAISIRLGPGKTDKDKKAAVAFDTELLRYSAGWTGDFVHIYDGREGLAQHPDVAGNPVFGTMPGPGWSKGDDWKDPRPDKLGPMPADWAKYRGLFVHGDQIVLSYTVGQTAVLDKPGLETIEGQSVFTRTLEVGPSDADLSVRVCEIPGGTTKKGPRRASIVIEKGETDTFIAMSESDPGLPLGTSFGAESGGVVVTLPPHKSTLVFKLALWSGPKGGWSRFQTAQFAAPEKDLRPLTEPGPARYEVQTTAGQLGKEAGPYAVDTLTAPDNNPWKSFLRFAGHDFFSNGDAAVCSISGDVWVVSGIDDTLAHLKWKRFATGLFQPLGLKIVDDTVYVLGRDQITRLHDTNHDGEADYYETFNNDCKVTENGHAYTTNLETDPEGNFYYAKCGDGTAHGGTVLKVSKYGDKLEVFATGVRNCNGLGMGPAGQLTEADNEGEWVPASRIDFVRPGTFLGFQPMSHRTPPPTDPGKPVCWMPQNCDNSCGGQVWVTGDKWGPFQGEMLHTSYGAAALYHVMTETVDGAAQGGVYRFPLNFATGVMRGRFRPADGQLYLTGLRGWQTAGTRDGALQRVRYTGKPVRTPAALHVHHNGIRLSFTCPLDPKTAADTDSWSVLQWNYHWSSAYGSAHWSVSQPARQGYDVVPVKAAHLSKDGKTVFLEIDGLKPVMQMQISWNLDAADGTEMKQDLWNTIHSLGPELPAERWEEGPDQVK